MRKTLLFGILGIAFIGALSPLVPGAAAPTVTTEAADNITSTSASLRGRVGPGGLQTDVYFISCDPTTSASFFAQTPAKKVSGAAVVSVAYTLSGLKPNTTYRFACTALNSTGKSTGVCISFKTSASTTNKIPGVTTLAATEVTSTTATLNANVNPKG